MARLSSTEIAKWMEGKRIDEIIADICSDNNEQKAEEKKKNLIYWGKDIKFLLRYLQQRQDFLALISTEWPEWTDVAFFMQDIMRWFFYQKHILDNIAASEGLGAFEYTGTVQEKKIRFHIFLVPEEIWDWRACTIKDRYNQLINQCNINKEKGNMGLVGSSSDNRQSCRRILLFTEEDREDKVEGCLSEDVKVAVPGGIIGYHAFYIIIENIIRNAAKHNFSGSGEDNLDVVIEILYDYEEKIGIDLNGKKQPAYLFRIYTNVGKIEKDKGILLWAKEDKKGINDKLATPLIDETGKLRKECWGMAEMKIAAGFLQGRSVEQIGSGGENIYGPYNRTNFKELGETTKQGSRAIIRSVESPVGTLGYEFYVRKPRIVGLVW